MQVAFCANFDVDQRMFGHLFEHMIEKTFYGDNNHHIAESLFKALARALRTAITIDPRTRDAIPSTKGSL